MNPTLRLLPLAVLPVLACMRAPDPARVAGAGAAATEPPGGAGAGYEDTHDPGAASPLVFEAPASWTAKPPSFSFTLAEYELPEGGVCTITQVGGAVEQNLDRWFGQFEVDGGDARAAAVTGKLEGAHYPTTTVELRGTLTATRSIGGGPPQEGWMLAGAAVEETPQGTLYVKVLGPEAVVRGDLEALWQAVRNLRVSG